MAKSSRASSRKSNNQKLKKNVFGPIETARAERLSAKLLELASTPKETPAKEVEMHDAVPETAARGEDGDGDVAAVTGAQPMEIDESSSKTAKSKIGKRRSKRKSSIIFPTYKERQLRRKKRV